jgi:CRP/FNR family transcriptional regulator
VGAGTFLYHPGTAARLAAVLDGVIRVFAWPSEDHQTTVRYAPPGDIVGLAPLLGHTQMTGAEAVTDARVALLSVPHVRAVAHRHPELAWTFAEEMAVWAAVSLQGMAQGFEPIPVRVARQLLDLAVPTTRGQAEVSVTHQRLADAVGTAREVITRVLGEFRQQGIVSTHSGHILILDRVQLARIAARQRLR